MKKKVAAAKNKFPKVLYVEWVDAVSDHGWKKQKSLGVDSVTSVGFLVAEDKSSITLAVSISDDQMNAVMAIPKSWISRRVFLTPPKQKKSN